MRTDYKKNFRRALHVICCSGFLLSCENARESPCSFTGNVFMQNHGNSYFSLNLLPLSSGQPSMPPLSILSSSLSSWMALACLREPIAAENLFEVNVIGWPIVASCDRFTPCSSPWLSGINLLLATFPTSSLIYPLLQHYPGAKDWT